MLIHHMLIKALLVRPLVRHLSENFSKHRHVADSACLQIQIGHETELKYSQMQV